MAFLRVWPFLISVLLFSLLLAHWHLCVCLSETNRKREEREREREREIAGGTRPLNPEAGNWPSLIVSIALNYRLSTWITRTFPMAFGWQSCRRTVAVAVIFGFRSISSFRSWCVFCCCFLLSTDQVFWNISGRNLWKVRRFPLNFVSCPKGCFWITYGVTSMGCLKLNNH